MSMQEVIIAVLSKGNENLVLLKKFIKRTGAVIFLLLITIVFSPLIHIWFKTVSGLTDELADLSVLPARIMVLLPLLTLLISLQRSTLVHVKNTSPVKWASAIEVFLIVFVLSFFVFFSSVPGVVGASIAYIVGRLGANIYLFPRQIEAEHIIQKEI